MTRLPTLDELGPLEGSRVLVRVDFNVPLEGGRVADDTRIRAALPTLKELRRRGASLVLMSHCGRPKGVPEPTLSLEPVARHLAAILDVEVPLLPLPETDGGGPAADATAGSGPGRVAMLENLRFHPGEKANQPEFAAALAGFGEVYVNDAFGTAHRAHASVAGVPQRMSRKAAGRLLERELEALGHLLDAPERPFLGIVGGAKIEGKIDTLRHLVDRLDALALGGGMANTFLAAQGFDLADSLVEHDRLDLAAELIGQAEKAGTDLLLPIDLVVTDDLEHPRSIDAVPASEVPPRTSAVDLGAASTGAIAGLLEGARTVFWNGPLGVFEKPPFDTGTIAVAAAVAASPAWSVIGGGETVAATRRAGVAERIGHVSTGGGAALELLAGKQLPGVLALEDPS